MNKWTIQDSTRLYGLDGWANGYFGLNESGNVFVEPRPGIQIDLQELIESLVAGGIQVPVLLRFEEILQDRVTHLCKAFSNGIQRLNYGGLYAPIIPIKVSPLGPAVQAMLKIGRKQPLGLEVGSKPELAAVLGMTQGAGALLLCNGFKDREYIELALMAKKLGWRSIVILEQRHELETLLEVASSLSIQPEIGIRVRPLTRGSGKWESSTGDRAKFGLSARELLSAIEQLKARNLSHLFTLLHFHAGSQVTSIVALQKVLRETARLFAEVSLMCPSVTFFDVGGGVAIDYEGYCSNSHYSMNYTIEEYACDVVYAGAELEQRPTNHHLLRDIGEFYSALRKENCMETYNDAAHLRDELIQSFLQGNMSLIERAYADKAFNQLLAKIRDVATTLHRVPPELASLNERLVDTFFVTFPCSGPYQIHGL